MYWLAVTFAIRSSILPAGCDMVAEDFTQESLILHSRFYSDNSKKAPRAQVVDSFSPATDVLDILVGSIAVKW
jgi:hypothetical protein